MEGGDFFVAFEGAEVGLVLKFSKVDGVFHGDVGVISNGLRWWSFLVGWVAVERGGCYLFDPL